MCAHDEKILSILAPKLISNRVCAGEVKRVYIHALRQDCIHVYAETLNLGCEQDHIRGHIAFPLES